MLFPLFILLGHGGSTILLFRGAFLFFHHLLQRFIVLSQHFTALPIVISITQGFTSIPKAKS